MPHAGEEAADRSLSAVQLATYFGNRMAADRESQHLPFPFRKSVEEPRRDFVDNRRIDRPRLARDRRPATRNRVLATVLPADIAPAGKMMLVLAEAFTMGNRQRDGEQILPVLNLLRRLALPPEETAQGRLKHILRIDAAGEPTVEPATDRRQEPRHKIAEAGLGIRLASAQPGEKTVKGSIAGHHADDLCWGMSPVECATDRANCKLEQSIPAGTRPAFLTLLANWESGQLFLSLSGRNPH